MCLIEGYAQIRNLRTETLNFGSRFITSVIVFQGANIVGLFIDNRDKTHHLQFYR